MGTKTQIDIAYPVLRMASTSVISDQIRAKTADYKKCSEAGTAPLFAAMSNLSLGAKHAMNCITLLLSCKRGLSGAAAAQIADLITEDSAIKAGAMTAVWEIKGLTVDAAVTTLKKTVTHAKIVNLLPTNDEMTSNLLELYN